MSPLEQHPLQDDILGNHRLGRPYQMMHEGRQIFSEWFDVLIAKYRDTFGTAGISAESEIGVIAMGVGTSERLRGLNREIQTQTLGEHLGFLALYTSLTTWFGREKPMLTMSLEDTIGFFTTAPIAIALDTWKRTPALKYLPPGKTVKEMLANQSYIECMEDLAKTGFGVLRTEFGGLDLEGDTHYAIRRARLGAQPNDTELITVEDTESGLYFSLAPWAAQALHEKLIEQNRAWPNHEEATHSGTMRVLPAPISAGCPVRNLSIAPLCHFLSEQIKATK